MGQTVNLLVFTFGGSNPSLPTFEKRNAGWGCETRRSKEGSSGRLYVVNSGWCASMRYVFAEVAQLIEH